MGMIGGGKDAFIGAIHRIAANMDGLIELSCGALSSSREKAFESGKMLFLPEDRNYPNYEEMILQESRLPAGQRMDFVSIVTPNHALRQHGLVIVKCANSSLSAEVIAICHSPTR